jgi:proline iminopeptidase
VTPEKYNKTLLSLHGGPGVPHDYLLPLAELATTKNMLRTVFYDQLGGGKSDRARDKTLYNLQSFREHLEDLRQELKLGKISLLGHSMGGCIILEYVLKYPENVEKLIISSSAANIPEVVRHMQQLKKKLPPEVFNTLEKYEVSEDYENPEYQKALDMMYKRHVLRMDPYPDNIQEIFNELSMEVYGEFWGPNEFICTGNVRDWNIMDRIGEIETPTLIIMGKYDAMPVEHAKAMGKLIKNSKVIVLEESSHMTMWENEAQKYIIAIKDFLSS